MAGQSALERIDLGSSGLRVSPLGVGTNKWGFDGTPDPERKAAFDAALAAGINFFDTAEVYTKGGSERTLGLCLASSPGDAVIATKFMPMPARLRKSQLIGALKGSLARLGLERVDLYMTHFPFPPIPINTWMDALADAVEEGLARAAGVSNYNEKQMRLAHAALARRGVKLASNQVEYSLLKRGPEHGGLLAACRELGVTLVAYRPLGYGFLGGKYTPENPPPAALAARFNASDMKKVPAVAVLLRDIGRAHGKTSSQTALNWVLCKGALPIPGARDARHVRENAGALGWRLSDDEVKQLDEASPQQ
jgi:aryl-alcohol dehydrogenase-like predicted oxidoreductase